MPKAVVYTCKICGIEKQKTNHWYVYQQTNVGLHINTWATAEREGFLDDDQHDFICGQRCMHTILDQYLESQQKRWQT